MPVELANTQQFTLHLSATGRDYQIQVSIPDTPPPPAGYPVLYVLDGNAYWPVARLANKLLMRHGPYGPENPLIIVGVGYPDVDRFDFDARAEDYTPPVTDQDFTPPARHPERSYGGADRFLKFVKNRLKPAIADRYDIDQQSESILGHSFGGLFALHTLFTQPNTFDNYFAISPSIWWGDGLLLRELETVAEQDDKSIGTGRCVLIGVGAMEQPGHTGKHGHHSGNDKIRKQRAMVGRARRLADRLQQVRPHDHIQFAVFPGESHGTVMWPTIRSVLNLLESC